MAIGLGVYGLFILGDINKAYNAGASLGSGLCQHAASGSSFKQAFHALQAQPDFNKADYDYNKNWQEVVFIGFDNELAKCGKQFDIRGLYAASQGK